MTTAHTNSLRDDWRKYMTDHNEGLGLVYERIILNDFLERLLERHRPHTVLEAPIYGMAGVSGINSVRLAQRGAKITLVDVEPDRLDAVRGIWGELNLPAGFVLVRDVAKLPFGNQSFDMVWNWAALWHLPQPEALLSELVRVSRNLIFIAMPNRAQVGYILRKFVLERDFVNFIDERWADTRRIKSVLIRAGARIIDEGVLDVPPWPDTVMPAAQVLRKVGVRSSRFSGPSWNWNTMDYYSGRRPELKAQMEQYAFLEHAQLPWRIKSIWAHHRYLVGSVSN
jgi:SAM-dependent methyltransferase